MDEYGLGIGAATRDVSGLVLPIIGGVAQVEELVRELEELGHPVDLDCFDV